MGVPGELHIGGIALARGYWGRPELTADRFVPDPFSEGGRLYRTGDLARVLPDGSIDYLGRLDHQVKIRGFRIELGEIEAALLGYEGVRSAAVLARQDTPGSPRLVAYVVAAGAPPSASDLRQWLGTTLPEYMVPPAFVFLDALPLSPSGKLDRRALPSPGSERSEGTAYVAPRTEPERTLLGIWESVLGRDGIGIEDSFFELGGDSILSLQIVARANQAGFRLTPEQMFRHPTVASLASAASLAPALEAEQGLVAGPVPLTPIQSWFFEAGRTEPHHWNQAVLLSLRRPLGVAVLERALEALLEHHDALRLRFVREEGGWRQAGTLPGAVPFAMLDLSALPQAERSHALERAAGALQAGLNLENGPIVRAAVFHFGSGEPDRLLLAIHHLAVDGVSWRILLEDLWTACEQLGRGEGVKLPPKTTSFRSWAEGLAERTHSGAFDSELEHWLEAAGAPVAPLPVDISSPAEANTVASARSIAVSLRPDETEALLQEVPRAYQTQINDVLLAALARAFRNWTGKRYLRVDLEGHGRENVLDGADVSRTVGWFTALYPVLLHLSGSGDPGEDLMTVKEELRQIPGRGVGFGLLRYLGSDQDALAEAPPAEVSFNYLGQLDRVLPEASPFGPAPETAGDLQSPRDRRPWLIEIVASLSEGRLGVTWLYSASVHRRDTVERLANTYLNELRALIEHCRSPHAGGFTPSDFPLADLGQEGLDEFLAALQEG
jgi:non-ribosomal peptide synthase protein (TIGR01720 family)